MKKTIALSFAALALFAGGACALHFSSSHALAAETEPPAAGLVSSTQKNFDGEEVEIDVQFDGKNYILADYTKNIYVYDGKNARNDLDGVNNRSAFRQITSSDGVFTDAYAVSVYHTILRAYEFFSEENVGVNWAGLNGRNDEIPGNAAVNNEIPLYVFVHYNTPTFECNAAFTYVAQQKAGYVFVGDGRADSPVYRQGASVDFLAHEYMHGVTAFINSGLGSTGDVGAINEAVSDIFGMLVEGYDLHDERAWQFGEDASPNGTAQRNAKDPSLNPYQKTTYSERMICYHTGEHRANCDNGWVHYNSTILTHLQYTAWELLPDYFTRERIGALWFKALQLNYNPNISFLDFANRLVEAAKALDYSVEAQEALQYSLYLNEFTNDEMHKVTFLSDDGSVLGYSFVKLGETAHAPEAVKEATAQYEYEFLEWDSPLTDIREDKTVRASFTESLRSYPVTFLDAEGNAALTEEVPYGSDAPLPEISPEKASTERFEYVFQGWEESYLEIKGETLVHPIFEEVLRSYTVTYVTDDVEMKNEAAHYGDAIATPVPNGYEGWYLDSAFTKPLTDETVTGDITVYAKPIPVTKPNPAVLWGIIGGVAGAAVLAIVIAVVLLRKKKN